MANEIVMLSDSERQRFITWLDQEVQSNKALISQMEKLGGLESLIKGKRAEMFSCAVVHKMLSSIEVETVD